MSDGETLDDFISDTKDIYAESDWSDVVIETGIPTIKIMPEDAQEMLQLFYPSYQRSAMQMPQPKERQRWSVLLKNRLP